MPKTPIFPFLGIDRRNSVYLMPDNKVERLENWYVGIDQSQTILTTFLNKFPLPELFGTVPTGSETTNCRGLMNYVKSNGFSAILQARSNGAIYYNTGTGWTSIKTGLADYPFETQNHYDLAILTNGFDYIQKWNGTWTSTRKLQNKSDTTALAGTVTFTQGSRSVTGGSTSFDTALEAGQYIKKDNTDSTFWYEIASVESPTALTLVSNYVEASGAGSSGGSLKSNPTVIGRHICVEGGGSLLIGNIIDETLDQSNTTSDAYLLLDASQATANAEFLLGTGVNTAKGVAQSWTTGAKTYGVGRIVAKMRRSGGTEGNIVCTLRTALGSGSVLGTATVAVSTLDTSAGEVNFDFGNIAVTPSTMYYACFTQDTTTTTTSVYVSYNTGGGLSNGSMFYTLADWASGYSASKTLNVQNAEYYHANLYQERPTTNYWGSDNGIQIKGTATAKKQNGWLKLYGLDMIDPTIVANSISATLWISNATWTGVAVTVSRILRVPIYNQITWNSWKTSNAWTTAGAMSDGNDYTSTNEVAFTLSNYTILETQGSYNKIEVTGFANLINAIIQGGLSDNGLLFKQTDTELTTILDTQGYQPTWNLSYTTAGAELASYDLYIKVYATGVSIDYYAQTIKMSATAEKISKIEILGTVLVSNANVTLDILAVDGSYLPSEATVIGQINATLSPTTDSYLEFVPTTPISVTGGTTYALRPRWISGGGVLFKYASSGNPYSDGSKCSKVSSWSADTNQDFAFKVYVSTSIGKRTIVISDELDGEDYPYTDIIVPLAESDQLTAIAKIPDGFVAFGENSYHIYKRMPVEPYFARVRSYYGIGCISAGTIAYKGDGTFYHADRNDQYLFTNYSSIISGEMKADVSKAYGGKSHESFYGSNKNSYPVSAYSRDKGWYISATSKTALTNDTLLIFDENQNSFFKAVSTNGSIYATSLLVRTETSNEEGIYIGSCNSDGKVNRLSNTLTTLEAGYVKPKRLTFGEFMRNKKIKCINFVVNQSSDLVGSLITTIQGDRDASAGSYSLTLAGTEGINRYKLVVNKNARDFEIIISDSISAGKLGIVYIEVEWEMVDKED